jgi:hypothetical protein
MWRRGARQQIDDGQPIVLIVSGDREQQSNDAPELLTNPLLPRTGPPEAEPANVEEVIADVLSTFGMAMGPGFQDMPLAQTYAQTLRDLFREAGYQTIDGPEEARRTVDESGADSRTPPTLWEASQRFAAAVTPADVSNDIPIQDPYLAGMLAFVQEIADSGHSPSLDRVGERELNVTLGGNDIGSPVEGPNLATIEELQRKYAKAVAEHGLTSDEAAKLMSDRTKAEEAYMQKLDDEARRNRPTTDS